MARRPIVPPEPALSRKTRRRGLGLPWGKLFLLGLVGVAALAWFAPTLLIKSSFRDRIVHGALADFPGKVLIGSASAGWLSPVTVQNASATDAQGGEVLTVASIQTEKNLLSLLMDPQQIGKIRLNQPKLRLQLRPDGSNLEDLLLPFLRGESSSKSYGMAIEIVDGTVEVTPVAGGNPWQLQKLKALVAIPSTKAGAVTAQIQSDVVVMGAAPGAVTADLQWQPTAAAKGTGLAAYGSGAAAIQSSNLPLDIISVFLRRAGLDWQLAGNLTTDTAITISEQAQSAKVQRLEAQNLFIASPSLLGADQLRLASLTGTGEIARSTRDWQFRNVSLQSELATLTASGTGPIVPGSDSIAAELTRAFRAGDWQLRGNLDIARLAAVLPNTMRLRSGTHVSSGQLSMGLTSQARPDGNSWNAQVEAQQLAAIHAGTAVEWQKPIVLSAAVRETPAGMVVDQLTCDSAFLQVGGNGTMDQGKFQVRGDLSQFVNEVGRFVDLGTLRAAGTFQGNLDWKRGGGGEMIELTGSAAANQFELTYLADRPWKEPQLDVQFQAAGKLAGNTLAQIDRGEISITAAGDQLQAQLQEPVVPNSAAPVWPVTGRIRGDLGRWLARSQMFFTLDPYSLDGDEIDIQGSFRGSKQRVEYQGVNGTIKNLVFRGAGLHIQEPEVQVESAGTLDLEKREFLSPATTLASSTVALRAEQTRLQFATGQLALDGDFKYRTDLDRLTAWWRHPTEPPTYRLQGAATGALRLVHAEGGTKADLTATIDRFAYATPARPTGGVAITPLNQAAPWQDLWTEPRLEVALVGSIDGRGEQAVIDKLQLAGDSLSIGAVGSVRHPLQRCELDLTGQYAYDLERLSQRLRGMLGPQVQMSGTGQKPFSFRGPLLASAETQPTIRSASTSPAAANSGSSLQQILAEASLGWERLLVQGFEIGPGEVATKLDRGILSISPISVPVSEGKIAIQPTIDVRQSPYIATLQPGTIVDRVRISPEMCRTWLKYLAPLAADATAAEGHFSVVLDDARFPVADLTGGNVQGKLVIHSAQIGPGPLSQELLGVAQLIKSILDKQPLAVGQQPTSRWLDMPEQQLSLQLADHRVYHRDMQFSVDDVNIRTSGWVGLNQQIALVAVIPVREEWVAKDRYLASLRGQSIQLPINGTLTRPQVDRTALTQLTRQAAIGAGTNILQDELNRGLNRIFQPKGAPAPGPAPAPQTPPLRP